MKLQLLALLSLVASIYAFPSLEGNVYELGQPIQKNDAEDRVREGFAKFIEKIQNEGYDPLEIDRREIDMNIAIVGLIFEAFIENVRISGLSDIRISSLEYSYLFNRLRIDVYIPQIEADINAVINGNDGSEYMNNLLRDDLDKIFELIVEHILWVIWNA
ncbi:unnamed protein product [Danaus chrysippus]|uniref:(African queen) hypothetical protein n=1 Tax=Danaus chrysippus TaxID=151541 RepID=A0A8J2W9U2_9NEOP|nr:unnamed protein product [Danaus chrysippus]